MLRNIALDIVISSAAGSMVGVVAVAVAPAVAMMLSVASGCSSIASDSSRGRKEKGIPTEAHTPYTQQSV